MNGWNSKDNICAAAFQGTCEDLTCEIMQHGYHIDFAMKTQQCACVSGMQSKYFKMGGPNTDFKRVLKINQKKQNEMKT